MNADFEKLNLIKLGPIFIDGQLYDGLRYDTSKFWALRPREPKVCSQNVNWQVGDTCVTDNTIYSTENAHSGNVFAYYLSNINSITGEAYFKDLGLSFKEPLIAGAEYEFCCFADFQGSPTLELYKAICVNVLDSTVALDFRHDLKKYITKAVRKPKTIAMSIYEDKACHNFDVAQQEGYQKICLRFTAKGGEKHLVIGNLKRVVSGRYKKNLDEDRFATKILFKSDIGVVRIDDCTLFRLDAPDVMIADTAVTLSITQNNTDIVNIISTDIRQTLLLASVYFEHGLTDISDMKNLDKAVDEVRKWKSKNCQFLVIGHTDGTGTSAQNAALSLNRARVVSEVILGKVPAILISCEGQAASESSPLPNPALRRADVYVIECEVDKK